MFIMKLGGSLQHKVHVVNLSISSHIIFPKKTEMCPKIAVAEPVSNIKNNHLKTNPYEILTHFMMKLC